MCIYTETLQEPMKITIILKPIKKTEIKQTCYEIIIYSYSKGTYRCPQLIHRLNSLRLSPFTGLKFNVIC